MQAIGRVVWVGQLNNVIVVSPYMCDSIDDNHRAKHNYKTATGLLITGDYAIDTMYKEDVYRLVDVQAMFDLDDK